MKQLCLGIGLTLCLLLGGCGNGQEAPGAPEASAPVPELSAPIWKPDAMVTVEDWESLSELLEEAIVRYIQPPAMDVARLPEEWGLEADVKNAYYALLAERPELDYAYNVTAELDGQGLLHCRIDYMPYRTGNFPEDFDGIPVDSLLELIRVARTHVDRESVDIRITDPNLQMSQMNSVLSGQVGGGFIVCQLNADGTRLEYRTEYGYTRQEALEHLREIDRLADAVVAERVREGMSQREAALACYTYLTEQVVYDWDYFRDPLGKPSIPRTPLGALRDHKAICGGFAQALQSLFERIGIPCWNVAGLGNGEAHLWNIAKLDGTWTLFDATFDAGRAAENLRYFDAEITETTSHVPHTEIVDKLIEEFENNQ